jgi:bacillithiol biosynthesis cysteine-adding enzyme BshC
VSGPIVVTETLGGSSLSRAARRGETPSWYRALPVGRDAWRTYAREVVASTPANWFEDLRPAMNPGGAAAARLERVAAGDGVIVTTGQQPGLFGGPLMTLVKALSARALADVLEAEIQRPVATVFWAATDDADFDEAAVVSIAGERGAEELKMERTAPAGVPMARVPIGADVSILAERLRVACGSAAHDLMLDTVLHEYRVGATVGGAYVAVLRSVLEPLGIAVLDASHPAVISAAAPLLRRAAERADAVASALHERTEAIRGAGFMPQVEEVKGLSLVFANEANGKRRLPLNETAAWLSSGAGSSLSSTVLLRPVVERAMLPTAMYVAGPGEYAYFAQVSAVAESLDAHAPLVVPRWSATVLEPRVQRSLADLGTTPDALRDPAALEGRVARELMPPALAASLKNLRDGVVSGTEALERASDGLVPPPVIEGLRRNLEHRLERAERRVTAAVKRREADAMRRIAALRGSLYPHGIPQERALSYVPFLARYGPSLLDDMLAQASVHARGIVGGVPAPGVSRETAVPASR